MNENKLIDTIKDITKSEYIGDDCAFLSELGITISQDSLVEDVHFRLNWMSAYELGVKTALVNISDIIASGAKPAYMTISLSLPSNIYSNFVPDFYEGLMYACLKFGVKIIGGDLTGSDKVFVSATVIGKTFGNNVASRSNARVGYKVMVYGEHGSSAAGLRLLESGKDAPIELIQAHKAPVLYTKPFPQMIKPFAMMDTSDGLADALFKIATASNLTLEVDFNKIPYSPKIRNFDDYENLILFGGEDYGLVAVVPQEVMIEDFIEIGTATLKSAAPLVVNKNGIIKKFITIDELTYKHF